MFGIHLKYDLNAAFYTQNIYRDKQIKTCQNLGKKNPEFK